MQCATLYPPCALLSRFLPAPIHVFHYMCLLFQRIGPSIRSGPSFCPKINATTEGETEILVPSGSKKAIKVKVENIVVSWGQGHKVMTQGHRTGLGAQ